MAHAFHVPFTSEADADRFLNLYTFAQEGRVIIDWAPIEDDEQDFDEDGDNVTPIYDESDRSDDSWFPLAQALAAVGYDVFGVDEQSGGMALRFHAWEGNDELVISAGAVVGIPVTVS